MKKDVARRSGLSLWFVFGFLIGAVSVWIGVGPLGVEKAKEPDLSMVSPLDSASKFGDWLAVQHAVYIDDFGRAAKFLDNLSDVKIGIVANTRDLVMFLDGASLSDTDGLKKGGGAVSAYRVIWAANQGKAGNWKDVFKEYKNEKSLIAAPFRIWATVGAGGGAGVRDRIDRAVQFIDSVPSANNSWKNFAKATVYAATKNPKTARKYFQKVSDTFMNIGDYHLVMSFYKKHGFDKDRDELYKSWVSTPGGMYMANADINADWEFYDTPAKMLGAMLVQYVSHDGGVTVSDAGLLNLRAAMLLGAVPDSVNYYTGGYFFAAGSDNYKKYWESLYDNPVYGPFINMKIVEKAGAGRKYVRGVNQILGKSPLFLPAIAALFKKNMQSGREFDAIRMLSRALKTPELPTAGRAYFLRLRAQAFYMAARFDNAEADLAAAAAIAPMDAGIMAMQARVWAAKKESLDEAYRYAISLIRAFPANVEYWSVLSMVVLAKEGVDPALEILERVGRVSEECSELFMNLGDLRLRKGLKPEAAKAYRKAIFLSDDGLIIKSAAERKLRKAER
ncbi:MAG: hypothetical protein LBQ49_00385 [Rickettsiales bacterium]|jgi:tetratricopeptide (TPR) repeat protein|nr:hypothetical protein [Rickettsiales bacterium]